jgi:ADP-dependent NAD(P)H-hydrate dehydratase / NAD(P)H-hydrate epimerase
MKLLYAQWMQELDAETINGIGIPSIVLMENASKGAADFFAQSFPLPRYKHVIVIAGKGNNGGDGFAAGRILAQRGYYTEFILLSNWKKLNPDPKINFQILKKLNLDITLVENNQQQKKITAVFEKYNPSDTFIIDALFGTGLNNPVRPGLFSDTINLINQSGFKVAAIDLPSGLSDTFLPEEAIHIKADITATFQSLKTAHLHPDGNKHCGSIRIVDIGIPHHLQQQDKYYIDMIDPADFKELFTPRPVDAHKGTYGHCLTICGSIEKPGAGILSSFAVLKSGAGLCTAAVCDENRTLAPALHPELMSLVYKEKNQLLSRLTEFNSLLLGPGLCDNHETAQLVSMILENAQVPVIMDADALNALNRGKGKDLLKKERSFPVVLTPHPGEFSRLTGMTTDDIRKNRIKLARDFAIQYNVYLILKGHHTLIATPGGNVYVNQTGNPGMATAGSGDVLSGMIAGMTTQFNNRFPISIILKAAVFLHGYAGDIAATNNHEISLTAADILDHIPQAIRGLDEFQTAFPFTN